MLIIRSGDQRTQMDQNKVTSRMNGGRSTETRRIGIIHTRIHWQRRSYCTDHEPLIWDYRLHAQPPARSGYFSTDEALKNKFAKDEHYLNFSTTFHHSKELIPKQTTDEKEIKVPNLDVEDDAAIVRIIDELDTDLKWRNLMRTNVHRTQIFYASRFRSCFCRQNQKTLKNLNEYTPEYTVPENRERPKILVTLTNLTGLSILTEAFPRAIE